MRRGRVVRISMLTLMVASLLCSGPALAASNDEEVAVMEAVEHFYRALNEMFTGDVGPMKEVWSHADDITFMGPDGGLLVGWPQTLERWEAWAALKIGGKVETTEIHMTVGDDIAVTASYEKGENNNAKGEPQQVSIRATNVFRKEDGKWKMIGHHTDLLPYHGQVRPGPTTT